MKKLLFLLLTLFILFTPALARADTPIDPCAGANKTIATGSQGFQDSLCGLQDKGPGPIIRNSIVAVFVIATILSLFFLVRGGVNWILSGGDKGKVDAARQTIVASVIGLIVTFLAFFIMSLVLQLFGLGFNNLAIPDITGGTTTKGAAPEGGRTTTGGLNCGPGMRVDTDGAGNPSCVPI
jgi:hypothetical protein